MKVYLVEDYNFDEKHIFSTIDKAKEFCRRLAEIEWKCDILGCEEDSFDKNLVTFTECEDCIYVDYDLEDIAIITSYELDKD